ncbi:RNase A-like domain-containing protein [Virgibacillus dokdonensis]|uniref:RNase A-like domain-containing protein n=1 Tax=Virgibacillus dokdonensis TaxID=302167 RepID=A0ABU7VMK0_9BACI
MREKVLKHGIRTLAARKKKLLIMKHRSPQSKSNLVLTYEGTEVIGRGVKRGSTTVENMTNARIVLKKDGEGNYILTGYPN